MTTELSPEEISKLIDEISLGGKIVSVLNTSSEEVSILITHGSLYDRTYAESVYEKTYVKAVKEGFLTVDQTIDIIRERGLFTDADVDEIESLRSRIEGQKKVLEKTTRVPARRDRLKNIIRSLESKVAEILYRRDIFLDNTAERRAQEEKILYLLWRNTFDARTKELLWKTKEDFEKEKDLTFRQNLFVEYVSICAGIPVNIIRYLARNPLWRIRYIASTKTGSSLFDTPISEYTVDQLSIAYWSNYYESVYGMMDDERPGESIIEDDAALDAFMKSYMEERQREATANRERKKDGVVLFRLRNLLTYLKKEQSKSFSLSKHWLSFPVVAVFRLLKKMTAAIPALMQLLIKTSLRTYSVRF